MPIARRLARIASLLLDAACGRRCAGCGSSSACNPCTSCASALRAAPAPPPGVAFLDVGVAARLVRCGKHGHWRGAGAVLARMMVDRLALDELGPVGVVTWVPADRSRRARRGGCLPESIARSIGRELGVPALPLLARVRASGSQRGRGRASRIRNAAGAYRAVRDVGRPLEEVGVRVLLVDDIRTTGATLAAASAALESRGMRAVGVAFTGVGEPSAVSSQRARNIYSRPGSTVPIRSGPATEREPLE